MVMGESHFTVEATIRNPHTELVTLLQSRRGSSCEDPRDLVYSLLDAATDAITTEVDYARPL